VADGEAVQRATGDAEIRVPAAARSARACPAGGDDLLSPVGELSIEEGFGWEVHRGSLVVQPMCSSLNL